ncbi:methyl-accepting chemotaxis protein [Paenibacillus sp. GCM10027626]|uniref:methyl-accepting chemotaxis protein n=1 Tax=Paenibacillus sp. GCM10027626 TaxID=3273411 RepID=UPI003640A8E1
MTMSAILNEKKVRPGGGKVVAAEPAAESAEAAETAGTKLQRTGTSQAEHGNEPLLIQHFLRKALIVSPSQTCREVIEQFLAMKESEGECAIVCEAGNIPVGLVMKSRLSLLQTHRFGRELYYERSIAKLMDREPLIIELSESAHELIDKAMGRDESTLYDCVIITEHGRIAGVLTMSDLLRMSRMLQQQSLQSQISTIKGTDELMQQIDKAVVNVHEAAQFGEQMSLGMVDLTHKGKNELEKVTVAFKRLAEKTIRQEQQIAELQKRADAISSVSKLIRELAEQSNLLAVNASIEAARAGEHGSGFSVVAAEIRKLSAQTKQSAEDINGLLRSIAEAVEQTVQLVAEGQQDAAASAASVDEASGVFGELFHAAGGNRESAQQIGLLAKQAFHQSEQVMEEMQRLIGEMRAGGRSG